MTHGGGSLEGEYVPFPPVEFDFQDDLPEEVERLFAEDHDWLLTLGSSEEDVQQFDIASEKELIEHLAKVSDIEDVEIALGRYRRTSHLKVMCQPRSAYVFFLDENGDGWESRNSDVSEEEAEPLDFVMYEGGEVELFSDCVIPREQALDALRYYYTHEKLPDSLNMVQAGS